MSLKLRRHPARAAGTFIPVFLALAGVIAFSGSPALAANASCGDTITTDTTLHKDLVNCPNNGILIGADNVTLNLNGHTIDGDGTPAAGCDPEADFCDTGVVTFGHDGVTVMHGSMRQFDAGVNFGEVRHTRLLDISSRNRVVGIQLFGSSRILVRNCSGNRTTAHDGDGIGVFESRHVRILNSSFRHNAHVGIKLAGSTNGVVKGNVAVHNGYAGFILEAGSHNVIKRNHVLRGGDGIRIEKGHGNLVAHNVVAHDRHVGIRLGVRQFRASGGAHNSLRNNLVRDSRVDDFLVVSEARHSLLKGNTARGAGDDGFDIESRSIKLTSNLAARNGDLGIEAVPGVKDGGGNVARHNGDPRQCTNIACS
jgi:parallel beta-helix repeat protein